MTAVAKLEFDIKRGVVDTDGLDASVLATLTAGVDLYMRRKPRQGADLLLPLLRFDWSWGECDRAASEVIADPQDIHLQCSRQNCSLRAGKLDGHLVLTTSVRFEVAVKDGINEEALRDWLDTNAAWACGTTSGGWGYLYTETNLYVASLRKDPCQRHKAARVAS